MATTGPSIDFPKDGRLSALDTSPPSSRLKLVPFPLLLSFVATTNVNAIPMTAGMMPAIMTLVSGTPKESETAMALGLGDIMFPAFPPPIMARRIVVLEIFSFLAISMAMGATVMTEMSINTPTMVRSMVAREIASRAFFAPSLSMMVYAIDAAAPDLIKIPAMIPAARILKMAVIIPAAPPFIRPMVSTIDAPPMSPPRMAPINNA